MTINLATTTSNTFRYPTASNDGDDFAAGIADLASDLDGMWLSGTLASRPSASKRGRVYYATDTSRVYFDAGSTWLTAMFAGPWTTLATPSGWTNLSTYAFAYRQVGDRIELRGSAQNETGSDTSLTLTVPAPASHVNLVVGNTSNNGINTAEISGTTFTGPLTIVNGIIGLDGCTYTLS